MCVTTSFNSLNAEEQKLLSVSIPESTDSYTPIPHSLIIESTINELNKRGLEIISKTFNSNGDGNKVIGYYGVKSTESDIGMMIGFRNSYDKSMTAGYVTGGNVWICGNGIISGDVKIIRKHTGKADVEIAEKLVLCIDQMESNFLKIKDDRDLLKSKIFTKRQMSELAGRLFFEEELINSVQVNIIKKEFENPTFKYTEAGNTAWDFYNFVTYSLKQSQPIKVISNHLKFHNFMLSEI